LYANAGGNDKYSANQSECSSEPNPLLSMHNYTTLVISGNVKNEQLKTLLSQSKLALTGRNMLMAP
jgi:hypothetical protein